MDELIHHLKELGFNSYESKVYLALLKNYPATGYEVSKESGVPQARAYDTLKTLENRGVVIANAGKPITYLPISPKDLLSQWERSFNHSLDFLKESLPTLSQETVEPILNIRGEAACNLHIESMINRAKRVIFLEIWEKDAKHFAPALEAAHKRGVQLNVVGYDGADFDFCKVYHHDKDEKIDRLFGARWLILAVDDEEGLIGNVPTGELVPKLVTTRNSGIVFVVKELVTHNIFLRDVENTLGKEIYEAYGNNLLSLRNKILGYELLT
ncbi:MAG: helix-turn-helix domain-containing protein [Vampirovibrionales bacterium]|nr:helix-turn-helix domain-containing protein [Vampirovibrionales bacterium]